MKKIVKLELEVESDDESLLTLSRILIDLEREIKCCDFWYEIKTISLNNLPITQNEKGDSQNENN